MVSWNKSNQSLGYLAGRDDVVLNKYDDIGG